MVTHNRSLALPGEIEALQACQDVSAGGRSFPPEVLLRSLSLTTVAVEGPAHAGSCLHTHLEKCHGQYTFRDETAASSSALRALSRSGAVLQ